MKRKNVHIRSSTILLLQFRGFKFCSNYFRVSSTDKILKRTGTTWLIRNNFRFPTHIVKTPVPSFPPPSPPRLHLPSLLLPDLLHLRVLPRAPRTTPWPRWPGPPCLLPLISHNLPRQHCRLTICMELVELTNSIRWRATLWRWSIGHNFDGKLKRLEV